MDGHEVMLLLVRSVLPVDACHIAVTPKLFPHVNTAYTIFTIKLLYIT